jgi:hypothetical protein
MEVWVNGAKVANFSGDHFNTHWNDPEYWRGGIYGPLKVWEEVDSQGHALKSYVQLTGFAERRLRCAEGSPRMGFADGRRFRAWHGQHTVSSRPRMKRRGYDIDSKSPS